MQKDLEIVISLIRTSSQQNQKHLNQMMSRSEEKFTLREELTELGKESQSMKDSTASEESEVIHELRMESIFLHGSLKDNKRSFEKVMLSFCSCESKVMRFMQQGRDLPETVHILQDTQEFKDLDCANCEVSGQTFTCVSDHKITLRQHAACVTRRVILEQQLA